MQLEQEPQRQLAMEQRPQELEQQQMLWQQKYQQQLLTQPQLATRLPGSPQDQLFDHQLWPQPLLKRQPEQYPDPHLQSSYLSKSLIFAHQREPNHVHASLSIFCSYACFYFFDQSTIQSKQSYFLVPFTRILGRHPEPRKLQIHRPPNQLALKYPQRSQGRPTPPSFPGFEYRFSNWPRSEVLLLWLTEHLHSCY